MTLIEEASRLKLPFFTHVKDIVEKFEPRTDFMATQSPRQFVKVAPPTVHAGVGNALRSAFRLDGETRSLKGFEDLLKRLD